MKEFLFLFDLVWKSLGSTKSIITIIIAILALIAWISIAVINAEARRHDSDNKLKASLDKNRTNFEIEKLRCKKNIIPP